MRSLIAALLVGAASPAVAQHAGHGSAPAQSCTPDHAAMGHCTMPAEQKPAADPHAGHAMPKPDPDPHAGHSMPAADPHAGHSMSAPDPHAGHAMPAADPHAGHTMPAADPHAGHAMPAPDPHAGHPMPAADPHAGHAMGSDPQPPKGPPPPAALTGPEHAADGVYDRQAMARSRDVLRREHGALPAYRFFVDRAETRIRDGRDGYALDAQAWFGGDIDKAWFKSEVEGSWGEKPEHAEVQALWSHALDPWFDLQTGVRYDALPGRDRAHLVVGIQGLAPYWWEVDGALFLSNKGEVTARAEAEYDLRITQKLVLQPRLEADLSFQDMPDLHVGAGLSQVSAGARLRYQISQLVAPYVGIEYERAIGKTARFRRADGEDAGSWNLLAGIRFWF